jgi:hypothetical protein
MKQMKVTSTQSSNIISGNKKTKGENTKKHDAQSKVKKPIQFFSPS